MHCRWDGESGMQENYEPDQGLCEPDAEAVSFLEKSEYKAGVGGIYGKFI